MFKFNLPIPLRIAMILGFMTSSVLWTAYGLRMLPDKREVELESRIRLGQVQTLPTMHYLRDLRYRELKDFLSNMAKQHPEIISVGVRSASGRLIVDVNDHNEHWDVPIDEKSDPDHFVADIVQGNKVAGRLEVRFQAMSPYGGLHPFLIYPGPMIVACSSLVIFLSWLFLRNILKQLDPSKVVPMRVRSALDALSEALFLVDQKGRIVLVNRAFSRLRPNSRDLIGGSPKEFQWLDDKGEKPLESTPWDECLVDGTARQGVVLGLNDEQNKLKLFNVNAVPIEGESGGIRGVLVSMDDITNTELRKAQMARMLDELRQGEIEIKKKNKELQFLATRDPLTGCLNRRSFYETFEKDKADNRFGVFSCAMVDIDHFKSINDNHGHAMGDAVLREVGRLLREKSPVGEKVCRFGGEEFCVFLPGVNAERALEVAESIRKVIAACQIGELRITASVGVSSSTDLNVSPELLLEESDKGLYFSKHNGRNKSTHFDDIPSDFDSDEEDRVADSRISLESLSIPFESVSGLMRALSYRHQSTATHSCRVANLCVRVAQDLMSPREVYILESAALLHDIGKIGVPDAILLKPGKLTDLEWQVMDQHDAYSVDIVQAAYGSKEVSDIVECHHSHYTDHNKGLPQGEKIPLGARILAICDAYDAMVSDRPYRKGRLRHEAIRELRRCAPSQFDPKLVEHFIETTDDYIANEFDMVIPTQCALQVGLHVEKLSEAVTRTDMPSIRQLTKNLIEQTESEPLVSNVTNAAIRLRDLADSEVQELQDIHRQTNELLDACRVARAGLVNFNYCRVSDYRPS